MIGYNNEKGLFQLTVEQLLNKLKSSDNNKLLQLSFAEIYNKKI